MIVIIAICLIFPQNLFPICLFGTSHAISFSTSDSSSVVQFNKKVFSWTDRVYITIRAPDFNSDPNIIDEIGTTTDDKVTTTTTGNSIPYRLVETGSNTGIFGGYVTLTGDPTLKGPIGIDGQGTNPSGLQSTCNPICGPTDGFLPTSRDDGITVSFEYNRNQVTTGSGKIQWNSGSMGWLESRYPINDQAILQITDADMSINPDTIDTFETNVWSDSDSGGIKLAMTETGPNTGIFQGIVHLTDLSSSGSRLHVLSGDTITAEYVDRTLPPPYSPSDQLRQIATTVVGSNLPPLEQAPASNARILDSAGNSITRVLTNQQIQVVSDVTNQGIRDQPFAYLVQIQDNNGITVSLSWITGSMVPKQTLNLGQSWLPTSAGIYTAQIFVWQSISNPNALSPPLSLQIQVS